MSNFVVRLFEEHDQLQLRIDSLERFILLEQYDSLPEIDRKDLKEQLAHMRAYYKVLHRRVSRKCTNA